MKTPFRTALITTAALFALAGGTAAAASPDTIIRDARDGSIDGNYTLAELRAADAAISADVREYNLWDEVYAVAVARATNENAPKPKVVKPTDRDGDGQIEPEERAQAARETRELNKQLIKKLKTPKKSGVADMNQDDDGDDPVEADAAANTGDDDDGGTNWPLVILVLAIIAIAAVGAWRVYATRKQPGEGSPKDPRRPDMRGPRDGGDTGTDTGTGRGPRQ